MPPAGSGESDVLSYCTFFELVLRRRSWFACWWLALPWLLLANMLLGPRGVGGSCERAWCVCVCSRRGLRTQYIRETFSLSCFRRHVLFLGFFRGSMEDAGARDGWGASGSTPFCASSSSSCVDRGGQALSVSPLESVYSSCMHASRRFEQ